MRAKGLLLCMLACFVTLSRAEVVEVGTAEAFVAALAVEPNSDVEIKLTDHITLDADISLDNITSLAIWGACTTPPPNVTDAKPGMCNLDLVDYEIVAKIIKTMSGLIDPLVDWVQLYLDNIALTYSGGLKWDLKATTLWLVDSSVTGFQEMQLNNGSLYIIDSTVTDMPLGMGITVYGGGNPEIASESSVVFVGSTLNIDKFPNVNLNDPEEPVGYLVIHDSTLSGTSDAKVSYSVYNNVTQKIDVLSDSVGLGFYDNSAGVEATPEEFSLDKVADWKYHAKNLDFLTTLDTDGAPGASKAMDPFGTGLSTPTPPDSASADAPPSSKATPPPSATVQSPPKSSATKPAMAVAAAILLLLALV